MGLFREPVSASSMFKVFAEVASEVTDLTRTLSLTLSPNSNPNPNPNPNPDPKPKPKPKPKQVATSRGFCAAPSGSNATCGYARV